MVIAEASKDETFAKLALSIGARGAVQTKSFRAFTEEEDRKIIVALPLIFLLRAK